MGEGGENMNKKQKKMLTRIIIAFVLIVVLSLLPVDGYLEFALYMIPYLVIGYDILIKAFKGIRNKQVFDENFLMAVATIGAILLKRLQRRHSRYAVLPDRRAFPELCSWQEPPQHHRTDGYPPGLCQHRKRW